MEMNRGLMLKKYSIVCTDLSILHNEGLDGSYWLKQLGLRSSSYLTAPGSSYYVGLMGHETRLLIVLNLMD